MERIVRQKPFEEATPPEASVLPSPLQDPAIIQDSAISAAEAPSVVPPPETITATPEQIELLAGHWEWLVELCNSLAKGWHGEIGEDLAQATWLAFLTKAHTLRELKDPTKATEQLQSWLRKVARNEKLRIIRTRRMEDLEPPEVIEIIIERATPDHESPETYAERKDRASLVAQAMPLLPERQAEVLRLRYLEERSIEEITAELGIGRVALRGLLYRARKKLGELLLNKGYEYGY